MRGQSRGDWPGHAKIALDAGREVDWKGRFVLELRMLSDGIGCHSIVSYRSENDAGEMKNGRPRGRPFLFAVKP